MYHWTPTSVPAKCHLDTLNGLSRVYECDRRQTDHATEKCCIRWNRLRNKTQCRLIIIVIRTVCNYSHNLCVWYCVSVSLRWKSLYLTVTSLAIACPAHPRRRQGLESGSPLSPQPVVASPGVDDLCCQPRFQFLEVHVSVRTFYFELFRYLLVLNRVPTPPGKWKSWIVDEFTASSK